MLSDGLRLTALGVAVGLAGALALTRLRRSLLYGIGPNDAPTLIAVVAFLGTVSLCASLVPAWRAARVDPSSSVRAD